MAEKKKILGETRMMNCGMKATCIAYRSATDIDVQFEDGTIVKNRLKSCFLIGTIKNPNYDQYSCLGVIAKQKCGQNATCIKYFNNKDIDVQFDDGTIVIHKSKKQFLSGGIQNPNSPSKFERAKIKSSCLGESILQNCGMEATCIRYADCKDIDVQFKDGLIIKHRRKTEFMRGLIYNPNIKRKQSETVINDRIEKHSCIGETILQNCGMKAICIAYRKSDDIDVKFEDGTVVYHRQKSSFLRGGIDNPNYDKISCLGQTLLQNCGMKATCIAYRKAKDIDVQFEDGTIVRNRVRYDFVNGKIGHPNINHNALNAKSYSEKVKKELLNKTLVMNNGQKATCIAYRNAHNIDVQFEDGTIIYNKNSGDFIRGELGNPNFTSSSLPQRIIYECILPYFPDAKMNYRPEWLKNINTGFNLEIDIWLPKEKIGIEYDGYPWHGKETSNSLLKYNLICESNNIQKLYSFIENGSISYNSSKHINFMMKCNSRSNLNDFYKELEKFINIFLVDMGFTGCVKLSEKFLNDIKMKSLNSIIGKKIMQHCGMEAICIAYRGSGDIDVQFSDGTIVEHKTKSSFEKSSIQNPNMYKADLNNDILGIKKLMNCGMEATCIAYRGSGDIDIQFADGTIVKNKRKQSFLQGGIQNPNMLIKQTRKINGERKSVSCLGEKRMMNCGMEATCIAYRGSTDIDIKFADGTIVKNKRKASFYSGQIKNPNCKKQDIDLGRVNLVAQNDIN